MSKTLFIVALLLVAGFAYTTPSFEELSNLWESWKEQHGKFYAFDEEPLKFSIFVDNYHHILKFNEENDSPRLALNEWADLTKTQFKAQKASCAFTETDEDLIAANTMPVREIGDLPASVDWRNKGAVTPVKNQGQCGSCWSFSTTGVLEGNYFLQNQKLLSFSEQQIVDCDNKDGNQGCDGGWPYLAVKYAAENGLELEDDYPYKAVDGTCKYDKSKTNTVAKGYTFVTANNTVALQTALVDSPVSVLIEADQDVFQFYTSGVIHANCGNALDHAVLAVGYEKRGIYNAFIVKNSWGTSWGASGYVYISTVQSADSGSGVCGILSQPLVASN